MALLRLGGWKEHLILIAIFFSACLQVEAQIVDQATDVEDTLRIFTVGEEYDDQEFEVPASNTVIDREEMDRRGVINLRDLFELTPGVEVRRNPRYGIEDINIRGIDGNRILYELNGVRMPERFELGPFRQTRGQWFDLFNLDRVDVQEGPAPLLKGDGAIGGVVSFFTLTPDDFLEDQDFATELLFTTNTQNSAFAEAARIGFETDQGLKGLLSLSRIDSKEPRVMAEADLINKQLNDGTSINGRFDIPIGDDVTLSLIGFYSKQTSDTSTSDANLPKGWFGYYSKYINEQITNQLWQVLVKLEVDQDASNPWTSGTTATIYFQDATQEDDLNEKRITDNEKFYRNSVNQSVNQIGGLTLRRKHEIDASTYRHDLHYGLDFSRAYNSRRRDRVQRNLIDGTSTRELPLGTFPLKDYPDSVTTRGGIFIEDTMTWQDLKFIAGIRYEAVNLDTWSDDVFEKTGAVASGTINAAPTWRLALMWNVDDANVLWFNYNRAFRTPLYNEINSGFTNTSVAYGKYKTISNPNLKPEYVDGFELGWRGKYSHFNYALTGYYNFYDNFIETFGFVGYDCLVDIRPCPPEASLGLYQSNNITKARIYGYEINLSASSLEDGYGFYLSSGLNYTIGDDADTGLALESIDPWKGVVALGYRNPMDRWSTAFTAAIYGRARVPSDSFIFVPPSFARFNWTGNVKITEKLILDLGVNNVFNYKQFSYADTKYIADNSPVIDAYSLPERSYRLGLSYKF